MDNGKKEGREQVIHIRVSEADKARIAAIARQNKRTVSDWVRLELLAAIEREQQQAA